MKVKALISQSLILSAFFLSSFAYGAGISEACKAEIQKLKCDTKNEKTIYECIEKNEDESKPNEGLSHACHEAHEVYEKKSEKTHKE
jgi:hypothetical protein